MKLIAENLNELKNFERKKDTLSSLNIGKQRMIEEWLNKIDIRHYTINDDFTIYSPESVDLTPLFNKFPIYEFPDYIQFEKVNGYFDCSDNELISLKGCPYSVSGSFICAGNNLISLDYCPKIVEGTFVCVDNKVQFSIDEIKKYCKCKHFRV